MPRIGLYFEYDLIRDSPDDSQTGVSIRVSRPCRKTDAMCRRLSTACATDNEPVPDTARSGHANAIVSQPRWYKKSVRSLARAHISEGLARYRAQPECVVEFA